MSKAMAVIYAADSTEEGVAARLPVPRRPRRLERLLDEAVRLVALAVLAVPNTFLFRPRESSDEIRLA